ncbi:MAG: FHA domain-containing protein [Lachnospiraceae bacterium]|nr:FHA domain-containing protein [Lachnospiraceae bacterium]
MNVIIKEGSKSSYSVNLESYGKDVVSFGRNSDNDIILNTSCVSRVHGCFFKENGGWKISDMNSTNGLYEHGNKIKEKTVDRNTEIIIQDYKTPEGKVVFTFQFNASPMPQRAVDKNTYVPSASNDLFVDGEEVERARIGSGYLDSAIRGGGFSKGYGILSNKRFYFRGRCYTNVNSHLTKTDEEWTVDLEDITSTGFVYRSSIGFLISAIIVLIAGLGIAVSEEEGGIALLAILVAIVLYVIYLLTKRAIYYVTFAGGCVGVDASKYGGTRAVKGFDRVLRREKDIKKAKKA